MKRLLSLFLAVLFVLAFVGCAETDVTDKPAAQFTDDVPAPTFAPTDAPTASPTAEPTAAPTVEPTAAPAPTDAPTANCPSGYNAHDYEKIVAFLETEDENGVKNGEKCFANYDPMDPKTWHTQYGNVNWSTDKEKRVVEFGFGFKAFVGTLELSGCTALKDVTCWADECNITEVDLSGCSALETLNVADCYTVERIVLTGCISLKELTCEMNKLKELDLSDCPSLERVNCRGNLIESLNLKNRKSLETLSCFDNKLKELDLTGCSELTGLYCSENNLKQLTLSGCLALETLFCHDNKLTELDLSDCRALKELDCYRNRLTKLDLTGNPLLYELNCIDNRLVSVDVSNCAKLEVFYSKGNLLTEIDMTGNPYISFELVSVSGRGTVAYNIDYYQETEEDTLYAVAEDGAEFLGWYTENGKLLTKNAELCAWESPSARVVARFK